MTSNWTKIQDRKNEYKNIIINCGFDDLSVRGALNSLYDPSNNLGIIISFSLGNYLSCMDQAKVQLIMPVAFTIFTFWLPESPEFWITKNKEKVSKVFDSFNLIQLNLKCFAASNKIAQILQRKHRSARNSRIHFKVAIQSNGKREISKRWSWLRHRLTIHVDTQWLL